MTIIRIFVGIGLVLLAWAVGWTASGWASDACARADAELPALTGGGVATRQVAQALAAEVSALPNEAWRPGYCRAVLENLARKSVSRGEGVAFDADAVIRTTVKYEAFRVSSFRNSGVLPKLYFGFLDGHGRTAAYEKELLSVAARVAPILNAYSERNKLGIAVSAKEIVVTHIAEGGALLLTTAFAEVDHIHPVLGIGLDDYRLGFQRFPGLTSEIDAAFGTRIAALKGARDDAMTFTESILGTAVMWLYEKDIAEKKLAAEGRPSLSKMSPDEQFVVSSLVYNSGILFSDERVKQILAFETGAYLAETSERSATKRPRLPVMTPAGVDALLASGSPLPEQRTSWNAVYHILQRYGAWVALSRYSNAFKNDGGISNLE